MGNEHYKDQLSAYIGQELSKEDRHKVAEHLIGCEDCRREHDTIRLGSALASHLVRSDAPDSVWRGIKTELEGGVPGLEAFAQKSWFDLRQAVAFTTAIAVVGLLAFLVYRGLFTAPSVDVAIRAAKASPENYAFGPLGQQKDPPADAGNANLEQPVSDLNTSSTVGESAAYWPVETIAGEPKAGAGSSLKRLAVGEVLETDAVSRVRLSVAEIGNVEIAPNSRVKLVGTSAEQHRLSLERGKLHARIAAPPRLFIVDTPSAVAVDLGCEYTLEVDRMGNSKLVVTGGFVALERDGRESIVPAGASCLTMKGKGLGTPFSTEATPEFTRALYSFDFAGGGSRSVKEIAERAELYDIITLWHLLSRVSPADRTLVYNALSEFVPPPFGVTRDGILKLDQRMLSVWREAVEAVWFE